MAVSRLLQILRGEDEAEDIAKGLPAGSTLYLWLSESGNYWHTNGGLGRSFGRLNSIFQINGSARTITSVKDPTTAAADLKRLADKFLVGVAAQSIHPNSYKAGLIWTLLHRFYRREIATHQLNPTPLAYSTTIPDLCDHAKEALDVLFVLFKGPSTYASAHKPARILSATANSVAAQNPRTIDSTETLQQIEQLTVEAETLKAQHAAHRNIPDLNAHIQTFRGRFISDQPILIAANATTDATHRKTIIDDFGTLLFYVPAPTRILVITSSLRSIDDRQIVPKQKHKALQNILEVCGDSDLYEEILDLSYASDIKLENFTGKTTQFISQVEFFNLISNTRKIDQLEYLAFSWCFTQPDALNRNHYLQDVLNGNYVHANGYLTDMIYGGPGNDRINLFNAGVATKNDARRIFETRFCMYWLQYHFDYLTLQSLYQHLFDRQPTDKIMSIRMLSVATNYTDPDDHAIISATTINLKNQSPLYKSKDRTNRPTIPAKENEGKLEPGDIVPSGNSGLLRAVTPRFTVDAPEDNAIPMLNRGVDAMIPKPKAGTLGFSRAIPQAAFTGSVSGHFFHIIADIARLVDKHYITGAQAHYFLKASLCVYSILGYHSVLEILPLFSEANLSSFLTSKGISNVMAFENDVINYALRDTAEWAKQVVLTKRLPEAKSLGVVGGPKFVARRMVSAAERNDIVEVHALKTEYGGNNPDVKDILKTMLFEAVQLGDADRVRTLVGPHLAVSKTSINDNGQAIRGYAQTFLENIKPIRSEPQFRELYANYVAIVAALR